MGGPPWATRAASGQRRRVPAGYWPGPGLGPCSAPISSNTPRLSRHPPTYAAPVQRAPVRIGPARPGSAPNRGAVPTLPAECSNSGRSSAIGSAPTPSASRLGAPLAGPGRGVRLERGAAGPPVRHLWIVFDRIRWCFLMFSADMWDNRPGSHGYPRCVYRVTVSEQRYTHPLPRWIGPPTCPAPVQCPARLARAARPGPRCPSQLSSNTRRTLRSSPTLSGPGSWKRRRRAYSRRSAIPGRIRVSLYSDRL